MTKQHAVTPIGLFRIAATARWINVPEPRVKNPQTTASNAVIVKAGPIKPEPMQVEEVAPPSEHNIRAEEETELVNSKEILAVAQLEPMAEIAPGRVIEDPAATVVKPEPSVNIGPNEGMAIGKGALVDSNVTNINEKIKNKAAAIGVPLKFEAMAPPTTSDPCPKILQEPLSSSTKMAVEPGEWFFVDGHQKPQASAGMAPIAQFA